jgi:hypothetical protein
MSQDYKKPRLGYYQSLLSYEEPDLEQIIDYFIEWTTTKEYLIFRRENIHTHKKDYKAVKAKKRGNDVYAWDLSKRLKPLYDLPEIEFFNYKDRNSDQKTRAVFVTLTYRRDVSLDEAWYLVGKDFNRWISGLRRKFGKIEALRCWEAQRDGFPHIHCVFLFREVEFDTFFHNGKWRIRQKGVLTDNWHWGFCDVLGLCKLGAGVGHITKYITKVNRSLLKEKRDRGLVLSLALMWIYRKRAFSVSRGFAQFLVVDVEKKPHGQVDLEGNTIYKWYLIGFYIGDFEEWSRELTYFEFWEIRSSRYFTFNEALI